MIILECIYLCRWWEECVHAAVFLWRAEDHLWGFSFHPLGHGGVKFRWLALVADFLTHGVNSLAPSLVLCTMFQSLLTSLPELLYSSLTALSSTYFYYTLSTEGYRLLDQLFM